MALIFATLTILFILIVEVFCVLLRLTGLSEEKARFQVVSLLTTIGFTGNAGMEFNNMRRKLAMIIMIVGYCGSATLVSFLISLGTYHYTYRDGCILLLLSILLLAYYKLKILREQLDKFVEYAANKVLTKQKLNKSHVLDVKGIAVVTEITILTSIDILNTKIGELTINKDYGIKILLIDRKSRVFEPTVDDVILLRDKVVLFGNAESIRILFKVH